MIEITFAENATVDELSYLSLTLEAGEGAGYALSEEDGQAAAVQVTVEDNDETWAGAFEALEVDFDLLVELITDTSGTSARLFGSDTSVIPPATGEGYYPATTTIAAPGAFEAVFEGIGIPATANNQLGAGAELALTLAADSVEEELISGTGRLEIVFTGRSHLDTRVDGTFSIGTFSIARRAGNQPTGAVALE